MHLICSFLLIFLPKGSSKEATKQKLDTWKAGFYGKIRNMEHWRTPVLLGLQLTESLKACGCEMIHCAAGEVDGILAKSLIERPKALFILSRDSDFGVFKGGAFVPPEPFDLERDLCDEQSDSRFFRKPTDRLIVGIISAERVQNALGVRILSNDLLLVIFVGSNFDMIR